MSIDLTPVFQAVITLLAALVTYKLIPWIRSKTTQQQRANITAAVKVAVYAAEQVYGAGNGDQKLAYAISKLRDAGYDVNKDMIRETIEKAVYEMQEAPLFADAVYPLAQTGDDGAEEEARIQSGER